MGSVTRYGFWIDNGVLLMSRRNYLIMRKIEQKMIQAIFDNKNWSYDNTSVEKVEGTFEYVIKLHGNKIAEIGSGWIKLYDGGWRTVTTKSRLSALLSEFGKGSYVYQKNFQWYIETKGEEHLFTNGFRIGY